MKKRFLRHLAIFGVVILFTGYFAFQTLLFPPIQKPFGPDLSTLVPDSVDFFIAHARSAFRDSALVVEHNMPFYRDSLIFVFNAR